jgi:S1-C subfamily serine protease
MAALTPSRSRALALALGLLCLAAVRQLGTLKIVVTIVDDAGQGRPVPRHALLISENPATRAPQRVVTSIDGKAELHLTPGNYTIESDEPLIFRGKSYEWNQTVDVVAGRDTAVEFTAANAQTSSAAAGATSAELGSAASAATSILMDWQDSVVSIWSPTHLGAGFVIDGRGLIATNQRVIGAATRVEVQLSATDKVAARVLAADATRNVAVLWVAPSAIAALRPMKLAYADTGAAVPAPKARIYAIDAPLGDRKSLASGNVGRVATHTITSDIRLDLQSAGTPLVMADGAVVAITTTSDDAAEANDVSAAAVRIEDARAVIEDAVRKMAAGAPPPAAALPVEAQRDYDDDALRAAAQARAGSLSAFHVAAADFDIDLITPVMLYGSRHRPEAAGGHDRERGRSGANPEELQRALRALIEFANWSDYVDRYPPVVLIRVTPKLVEGFWTTVARGAAQTQGVSVPAIKHVKTPFANLRAYCGDVEVAPIHPLKIAHPTGATSVIYEGLYAFDPDAIGPRCASVKLAVYSEKEPAKPDTRTLDAKIVEQVWQDFAPYRGRDGR